LLMSENALADATTWTLLNNAAGKVHFGKNSIEFHEVFMRGNLMMAAAFRNSPNSCANIGIWRSTDSGVTWTNVLRGVMWGLAADPNSPNRFYAAGDYVTMCSGGAITVANGVYRSDDSGATWTPTNYSSVTEGTVQNAKISVSASGSRVWASLVSAGTINTISYSDNQGTSWTAMDPIRIPDDNTDDFQPTQVD